MRITAYRSGDDVYLQPHLPQAGGPDLPGVPCLKVAGVDAEAIGDAIDQCQAEAHIDGNEGSYDQLMRLAGAKNLKAFQRQARIVSIDATKQEITFWPTKAMGARKGYVFIDGPPAVIDPDASLMGARVLQAFDMCE